MLHNNPIILGLSEFAALHGEDAPDTVVNLSTGTAPPSNYIDRFRRVLDSWPFQLGRGFLALMDSNRSWNAINSVKKRIPKGDGHFRLDVTTDALPALDDITKMPMLKSLVRNDPKIQKDIEHISRRLFASLFYFVLTKLPKREGTSFIIEGRVLCTRKSSDPALSSIWCRLATCDLIINGRRRPFDVRKNTSGNIQWPLECESPSVLSIELVDSSRTRHPISGSPYRVQSLVSRGGLADHFGNSTHKRKELGFETSQPAKKRRVWR